MDLQGMAEQVSRRRTAAIFGLLAVAVLLVFRIREAPPSSANFDKGLIDVVAGLLPAVGMLLALEAGLLLVASTPVFRRRSEGWTALTAFAHLVFLVFAVMDHRYFLATGSRLNAELVIYTLRYASSMGGSSRRASTSSSSGRSPSCWCRCWGGGRSAGGNRGGGRVRWPLRRCSCWR